MATADLKIQGYARDDFMSYSVQILLILGIL